VGGSICVHTSEINNNWRIRTRPSIQLLALSLNFLRSWVSQLEPYDISDDSLVELSLQIVRQLHASGQLDLSPAALQQFLMNHKS
jgi:hypothetical protein